MKKTVEPAPRSVIHDPQASLPLDSTLAQDPTKIGSSSNTTRYNYCQVAFIDKLTESAITDPQSTSQKKSSPVSSMPDGTTLMTCTGMSNEVYEKIKHLGYKLPIVHCYSYIEEEITMKKGEGRHITPFIYYHITSVKLDLQDRPYIERCTIEQSPENNNLYNCYNSETLELAYTIQIVDEKSYILRDSTRHLQRIVNGVNSNEIQTGQQIYIMLSIDNVIIEKLCLSFNPSSKTLTLITQNSFSEEGINEEMEKLDNEIKTMEALAQDDLNHTTATSQDYPLYKRHLQHKQGNENSMPTIDALVSLMNRAETPNTHVYASYLNDQHELTKTINLFQY